MTEYAEDVRNDLSAGAELLRQTADQLAEEISRAVRMVVDCLAAGNKVLLMGNGGSAADAQHIACELVGRFGMERRALPAIALTTNSSVVTAVANDYGYEKVFSRQVEALARPGDVVFAISTSGTSASVLRGAETAKRLGCRLIILTGAGAGDLTSLADVALKIPSRQTPRIQEAHIAVSHTLCRLVERELAARG